MQSYLQSNWVRQCTSMMFLMAALGPWCGARAQTVSLDNVSPISLSTSTTLSAVSIDPTTGNVTVRSSAGTYNQCTQPVVVTPVINQFFPSSSTVAPSGTITLNWQTTNATFCTPSQGGSTIWSSLGTLAANGSQNITAPSGTGAVTFQLNCSNGATAVTATTQVTVQSGPPPGNCTPIYPNGTQSLWNNVYGLWPAFGVLRRLTIPANGYRAFEFTPTSAPGQSFGAIALSDYPVDGDGDAVLSISRVAGCFNQADLGANCLTVPNRFPTIAWRVGSSGFSCALTAGQTYFFNMTYGSGTSGPGPFCPAGSGNCGADVTSLIQD